MPITALLIRNGICLTWNSKRLKGARKCYKSFLETRQKATSKLLSSLFPCEDNVLFMGRFYHSCMNLVIFSLHSTFRTSVALYSNPYFTQIFGAPQDISLVCETMIAPCLRNFRCNELFFLPLSQTFLGGRSRANSITLSTLILW